MSSCILLSSVSFWLSRNASRVRLFAYSRKLYAANWPPWRRRERYCQHEWLVRSLHYEVAQVAHMANAGSCGGGAIRVFCGKYIRYIRVIALGRACRLCELELMTWFVKKCGRRSVSVVVEGRHENGLNHRSEIGSRRFGGKLRRRQHVLIIIQVLVKFW
jgi:hypothetical protein